MSSIWSKIVKRVQLYYALYRNGTPVRQRDYKCRVSPEKIASCITYLQAQLPIVAGRTRNMKIDGHVIKNLPVYSRGGKSLWPLFNDYKKVYANKQTRIGRPIYSRW